MYAKSEGERESGDKDKQTLNIFDLISITSIEIESDIDNLTVLILSTLLYNK